jgi:WhiB family redox-sensing transcriptional regulator
VSGVELLQGLIPSPACRDSDPAVFFPGQGDDVSRAKAICSGCQIRAACLEHAVTFPERFGIWGGKSERERRQIRRDRRVEP